MEGLRILELGGMAQVRELHQAGAGDPLRGQPAQLRVVAEPGRRVRRGQVLADGGGVLLTDEQQGRHRQLVQLVDHRLGVDHVVEQGRIPGHPRPARAVEQSGQHPHRLVPFRAPLAGIVGGLLVGAQAPGVHPQLPLVPLVHADGWHPLGLPVLQADGVHQHQLVHLAREHQGIAHGQHAAGGVPHQAGPRHPDGGQQGPGVARQLLEAVLVMFGLGGLAEADLVRGHHPVAGLGQDPHRGRPGGGGEVLAVQQHHGAAGGGRGGRHIQVGHVQAGPLGGEREAAHRERVGVAFQLRPVDRCRRRRNRSGGGGGGQQGGQGGEQQDAHGDLGTGTPGMPRLSLAGSAR